MTCPAHDSHTSPAPGTSPQAPGTPNTKAGSSSPNSPVDRRAFFRQLLARGVGELEQRTRDITSRVQQAVNQAQTNTDIDHKLKADGVDAIHQHVPPHTTNEPGEQTSNQQQAPQVPAPSQPKRPAPPGTTARQP